MFNGLLRYISQSSLYCCTMKTTKLWFIKLSIYHLTKIYYLEIYWQWIVNMRFISSRLYWSHWFTLQAIRISPYRAAFPKSIVSHWFQCVYDVLKLTMLLGNAALFGHINIINFTKLHVFALNKTEVFFPSANGSTIFPFIKLYPMKPWFIKYNTQYPS